jgi:hypothetical protein
MSTRTQRSEFSDNQADPGLGAFNLLADLPRRQLALVTQSTSALLSMHAELLRFGLQAAQYWQQLATAGMNMHAELVKSAGQAALESAPEPTLDSLQRAFEATLDANGSASNPH